MLTWLAKWSESVKLFYNRRVKLASSEGGKGKEKKGIDYAVRRSYETKASEKSSWYHVGNNLQMKLSDRIKNWLIKHYVLQIIMTLNVLTLIALLVLELIEVKK